MPVLVGSLVLEVLCKVVYEIVCAGVVWPDEVINPNLLHIHLFVVVLFI